MTDKNNKNNKKLCLNMIVKDEEHIITETLSSILPYIDYYVISDTGSSDNTINVIKDFFDQHNIDGVIHQTTWKNFGYNRSLALKQCKNIPGINIQYVWVIDADDIIVGDLVLPEKLTKDCYFLKYGKEMRYYRGQIFNNELDWEYHGVLHEYPDSSKKDYTRENILGDYFIDSRRLGNRSRDSNKYANDAKILEQGLIDEPNNSRYVFYLAQSYMDSGNIEKAIENYRKRIDMGGWYEEVYYSYLKIGDLLRALNKPFDEIEKAYIDAFNYCPHRADSLCRLAEICRFNNNFELAYKYAKQGSSIPYPDQDVLFVFKDIYDYKILDELSIASYYVGKYIESYKILLKLTDISDLPRSYRKRIQGNIIFSLDKIKEIGRQTLVVDFGWDNINNFTDVLKSISLLKSAYNIIITGIINDENENNVFKDFIYLDTKSIKLLSTKIKIDHIVLVNNINNIYIYNLFKNTNIFLYLSNPKLTVRTKDGLIIEPYELNYDKNSCPRIDGLIFSNKDTFDKFIKNYSCLGINLGKDDINTSINDKYFELFDKIKLDKNKIKINRSQINLDKNPDKTCNFIYPNHMDRIIKKIKNKQANDNILECESTTLHNYITNCTNNININHFPYAIIEIINYYNNIGYYNQSLKYIKKVLDTVDLANNDQKNIFSLYLARCLNLAGNYKESFMEYSKILKNNNYSESFREVLQDEKDKNIEHFKDEYLIYPQTKVNLLVDQKEKRINGKKSSIVCSITTCKRYDLFEKTINSFLNCCSSADLIKINKWICVDDNSSSEDKQKMKNNYPFFDFIFKDENEKGHYKSMNIILNIISKLDAEYLLHIEDDFHFIEERDYVSESIKILSDSNAANKNIGQILFNKNYAEVEPYKMKIVGGINKDNYSIHEYYKYGTSEYNNFLEKHKGKMTTAYWPHFSFRPSMIRCKALFDVGLFYNTNHFEMQYANEYIERGYVSAFLNTFSCIHIGKKTWETNKTNSYQLNNVEQFSTIKNDFFVISNNIDSWKKFKRNINRYNLENNNMTIIKKTVDRDQSLIHREIWRNLCESNKDYCVVLNDDIIFTENYDNAIMKIIDEFGNNKNMFNILFLGLDCDNVNNEASHKIIELTNSESCPLGYIINKNGAKELEDYMSTHSNNINNYQSVYEFMASVHISSKKYYVQPSLILPTLSKSITPKKQDNYLYFNKLDSYGYDISYIPNKTVNELKDICNNDEFCVGFNTYGYMKYLVKDVSKLMELPNASFDDGLYIRKDRWINYKLNNDIVEEKKRLITKNKEETHLDITFTITSCKRLDCLIETLDNFIYYCDDLESIKKWILIDDGSSDEDKNIIKTKYPFFEFIFKEEKEKGHVKSLNILWNVIDTDYVLHFEDDWRIKKGFKIKNIYNYVKNNKNKTDQLIFIKQQRARFREIDEIDNYKVYDHVYNHNHYIKQEKNREYDKKNITNISHEYNPNEYWWWPSFSLNPSLFNFKKLKEACGNFDDVELFEYHYSHKAYAASFKPNILDLSIDHIGLTSSYKLNGLARWYEK